MERLQNVGRICCADSELCVNTFHPYEDSCDPTVRNPLPLIPVRYEKSDTLQLRLSVALCVSPDLG